MYYVTMTDKFMSGWGHAMNKINKLVITCDNYDEAVIVADNANNRSEMKYINITSRKPYYNPRYYYVSVHGHTIGDYKSWFIPGYFND